MTTTLPHRPSRTDFQVITVAAKALVSKVQNWCNDDASTDDETLQHLMDALQYGDTDGYKLASRLEDRHGYDPDEELVDILSAASFKIYDAHKEAVRKWVAENNIQPQFAVGQIVKYKVNRYSKSQTGEITKIDTETAQYTIFDESAGHVRSGVGTIGFVVPYEIVSTHEAH
jgi:hypothetical protein